MRPIPWPPHDPIQAEFERPKSWPEWRRYYKREIPLRDLVAQFCAHMIYFAQSDLAFIDRGLFEKPKPEIILAIEYVSERLERDAEVLATLYLVRNEIWPRETRWAVQLRILNYFGRMGSPSHE